MRAGFPSARGYQDDGGYPTTYPVGFQSVAETQTKLTRFAVTLQTYAHASEAAQAYQQLAKGGKRLSGIGDRAVNYPGEQVVVLKGSQLLQIGVRPTDAGLDCIAEQDKSPGSLAKVLVAPDIAAARAIAARVIGAPASGSYVQLPQGAIDPCSGVNALAAATKKSVTVANGRSENPPAQQCDFAIAGSPFLLQAYTSAQAAKALPATSLRSLYAQDARVATPGKRETTANRYFRAFMNVDTDWTLEFLVSGGTGGAAGLRAPVDLALRSSPALDYLIRIKNAHTGPLTREDCYQIGSDAFGQFKLGTPEAEVNKFFDELVKWCGGLPKAPK